VLDADIQSDGPATRPAQATMEVDGAKVTIDLDRGLLKSGGKLKATIVASSDTPKKLVLDVTAWENMGYGGERVENPPRQAGKRKITIEAKPGGSAPVEVAFTLGDGGRKGVVRWFDVNVMQHGVKSTEDDPAPSASAGAATWSGNNMGIAIEAPAVIPSGKNFVVGVRVTNTTKKVAPWVEVELGGPHLSYGGLEGALYMTTSDTGDWKVERVNDGYDEEPLKPGESRVTKFLVMPSPSSGVKELTLVAHAHGGRLGALETTTLEVTPEQHGAVAIAK
jgi:hypothetical protein